MSVAVGSCNGCHQPLVYLAWRNGKKVVMVRCQECDQQIHFDLETLEKVIGDPDAFSSVLANWNPDTVN